MHTDRLTNTFSLQRVVLHRIHLFNILNLFFRLLSTKFDNQVNTNAFGKGLTKVFNDILNCRLFLPIIDVTGKIFSRFHRFILNGGCCALKYWFNTTFISCLLDLNCRFIEISFCRPEVERNEFSLAINCLYADFCICSKETAAEDRGRMMNFDRNWCFYCFFI